MQLPTRFLGIEIGNWGRYPKHYDPSVHGRFDPATFYGKPDTPIGEVKLSELPAWILRREKGPAPLAQMIGRAYWRWQHKYVLPKKSGVAPFFQVAVAGMIIFYIINYPRLRVHRNYKYH